MRKRIPTEVGNLPEDWRVAPISEVADYVTDYVANGSFALLKENVTYKSEPDYAILIRLTDFSRKFGGDFVYVDEHSYHFLKKSQLQGGEIVVSNIGEYAGTVFRVPHLGRPMTLGPNALMMSFGTHNDFYFYWFRSPNGQEILRSLRTGSAVPKFNKTDFRNSKVPVPPPHEQKAIAEVLSSLDDKIDLLHRQNRTLESLAQTLFRQWFIEEADDRWENGVITDLVELNPKRILSKGTVVPYLEMSNLSNSLYHPTDWYDRQFSSGTKFVNGDTLLARITPCLENGKTGFVDFLEDEQVGWGSTEFIVMRSKETLHPFFAYILARHQDFRDFAIGCMVGSSGRQRADVDNLATYEIKIPPSSVINRFNKYIEPSLQKMKLNNKQIRDLVRLRDSLLPKLMSGEVKL